MALNGSRFSLELTGVMLPTTASAAVSTLSVDLPVATTTASPAAASVTPDKDAPVSPPARPEASDSAEDPAVDMSKMSGLSQLLFAKRVADKKKKNDSPAPPVDIDKPAALEKKVAPNKQELARAQTVPRDFYNSNRVQSSPIPIPPKKETNLSRKDNGDVGLTIGSEQLLPERPQQTSQFFNRFKAKQPPKAFATLQPQNGNTHSP